MYYIVTNNKEFKIDSFTNKTDLIYQNFCKVSVKESLDIIGIPTEIGFDIETTGLDVHKDTITLIQFGRYLDQVIIDCTTVDINFYKFLLENPKILKIGVNLKFDVQFLYKENIFIENVYDLMLAEYVLYNGLNSQRLLHTYLKICKERKYSADIIKSYVNKAKSGWYSLQALVYSYTGDFLDKNERANFLKFLEPKFLKYAALDVKYLIPIYNLQKLEIDKVECSKAIHIENRFLEVLAFIEFCGLKLNKDKWLALYQQNKLEYKNVIIELNNWIIQNKLNDFIDYQLDMFDTNLTTKINWNSPLQIKTLLKTLGIDITDKYGKESTEESVLKKSIHKSSIIPLLLKKSEFGKSISTYGEKFLKWIHPITGRIHADFTQLVDTSRVSCSSPNLTNIPAPKVFRNCFESEEGWLLGDADYSGQESVVLTNFSKEKNLIKFYKESPDADLHSYVAKLTFKNLLKDVHIDDVKAQFPNERNKAKTVEFGIAYGGDFNTVANNGNMPVNEAKAICKSYDEAFPDLKDYFDNIGKTAKQNGYIKISEFSGRRYYFPEFKEYQRLLNSLDFKNEKIANRLGKSFQRKAQNYPIQGSSAEITKIAAILLFQWLRKANLLFKIKIINIVHDEILVEFLPEYEELVREKVPYFMEQAGNYYCKIIPLTAELKVANYWIH